MEQDIEEGFNTASGKHCCNLPKIQLKRLKILSFNTASGKHCCNTRGIRAYGEDVYDWHVSIPQAVSTVATAKGIFGGLKKTAEVFQYRKR